jgi:DNA-binding transcriptional MerR regulator
MEYRVEEIARAGGVSVDTVRFYQSRGLLPAPERRGRAAVYSDEHLECLRRIRSLNRQGLTLEAVGRVLRDSAAGAGVKESLLDALAEAEGQRSYTRSELSSTSGVPEFLLGAAEEAGLLEPLEVEGELRYTEADLRSAEAGRLLLEAGLPLQELLDLARDHAAHTRQITETAIELFDRFVREGRDRGSEPTSEAVTEAFRTLLPAATTLVALHFQRTLIRGARARIAREGGDEALEAALAQASESRLKLSWS